MICPSCSVDMEPIGVEIAPPLAVCPACEHSLVIVDGAVRQASSADTESLTDAQLKALKKLRVETRKARVAYYQEHHAH